VDKLAIAQLKLNNNSIPYDGLNKSRSSTQRSENSIATKNVSINLDINKNNVD
jgi:hypothetical protein